MKHPLEAKIIAYLDGLDHQPTAKEFFEHFRSHHRLVELLVISSLYLDFEADDIIREQFKNSKDSEKIEYLIEEYIAYPELADFFIPKNVMAAALYKDKNHPLEAKLLIDQLRAHNLTGYYQDLYAIRELLFDGNINLEVADCALDADGLLTYLHQEIAHGQAKYLSDSENLLNYHNFYFYWLHHHFKIVNGSDFNKIIEEYLAKRDLELNPIQSFNTFLSGEFKAEGVLFKANLRGLENLFQGISSTKIKIKTDIGEVLKGFGSTFAKDQIADLLADYLIQKVPLAQEIKLGKSLLQAFISNLFEMTDISFLAKELHVHYNNINRLRISLKEYYIHHFLDEEFRTFFAENNFEYIPGELDGIYERLYTSFVQSMNSLFTPDMEAELAKKSQYKGFDLETQKFLLVCDSFLQSNGTHRQRMELILKRG